MGNLRFLGCASLAVLAWVATPAVAQDAGPGNAAAQTADEAGGGASGDIVVTARRRNESLVEVPISVTALSGESLAVRQITDALSLAANVPSLNVSTAGGVKSILSFSIRGQRSAESQLLSDPPVGLYFAEVNQPRTVGIAASLYDLQSVQVLKGVQGTLFGRNMTGGAVLIDPAAPTDRFEGGITAGFGNYSARSLEGMLNVPLGEIGALRFAGRINRRDGYITDLSNGRDYQDDHSDAFRISLRLNVAPDIENLTIFDYVRINEHGAPSIGDFYDPDNGLLGAYELINATYAGAFGGTPNQPGNTIPNNPAFGPFAGLAVYTPVSRIRPQIAAQNAIFSSSNPYRFTGSIGQGGAFDYPPVSGGVLPYDKAKNYGITNKTIIGLGGDLKLKNIFGYRKVLQDSLGDLDGLVAPLITAREQKNIHEVSEELQLSGKAFDGKLDFVTGLYYFKEAGKDGSTSLQFPELSTAFGANSSPNANISGQNGGGTATSYAGYGGITYALTDAFKFSAGLRYTHDKRKVRDVQLKSDGNFVNPGYLNACSFDDSTVGLPAGVATPPLQPDCSVSTSKSWSALTYDATIAYQPDASTNVYASFRHGFRAGSFTLRASSYEELVPANPEKVNEFEIGFKKVFDLGGGRLTTSSALFYQQYNDVQKQDIFVNAAGNVATRLTNVTKQRMQGGELELNLSVGRIEAGLGYSYVDIKVLKTSPALAGNYADKAVPKHLITGNITWNLPFDKSVGDVSLGANFSYKSRLHQGTSPASGPGANQPGYALVDGLLRWNEIAGSNFSASVFVKNVFDKFYKYGVVDIVQSTGIGASIYAPPRTYGMTIGYRF